MKDTLYDLVIGNIDGSKLPDLSHFVASVVMRSQAKKDERVYKNSKSQIKLSLVIGSYRGRSKVGSEALEC